MFDKKNIRTYYMMISKINMDWLIKEYTDIKDNILTFVFYDIEFKF